MQLIRCTKKLQTAMGIKPEALIQHEVEPSLLGSWHANLLVINRKKYVLFVNDKTLFNFITPAIKKPQWKKIDSLFKELFQYILFKENIHKTKIEQLLLEYDQIGFANTSNKSVVSSMNTIADYYKTEIECDTFTILEILCIGQPNRRGYKSMDYLRPIEVLHDLLNSKQ